MSLAFNNSPDRFSDSMSDGSYDVVSPVNSPKNSMLPHTRSRYGDDSSDSHSDSDSDYSKAEAEAEAEAEARPGSESKASPALLTAVSLQSVLSISTTNNVDSELKEDEDKGDNVSAVLKSVTPKELKSNVEKQQPVSAELPTDTTQNQEGTAQADKELSDMNKELSEKVAVLTAKLEGLAAKHRTSIARELELTSKNKKLKASSGAAPTMPAATQFGTTGISAEQMAAKLQSVADKQQHMNTELSRLKNVQAAAGLTKATPPPPPPPKVNKLTKSNVKNTHVLRVNVGGTFVTVSVGTLKKVPYFSRLLQEGDGSALLGKKPHFVDRPARHIRLVLDYYYYGEDRNIITDAIAKATRKIPSSLTAAQATTLRKSGIRCHLNHKRYRSFDLKSGGVILNCATCSKSYAVPESQYPQGFSATIPMADLRMLAKDLAFFGVPVEEIIGSLNA